MPSIAVIGSEGSGKTILIAALAKRFSAIQPGRPALIPKDRATALYVEKVWSCLQSQEWPGSTLQGEMASLTWDFIDGGVHTDLKMVDLAGQDLRMLFSEGRVHDVAGLQPQLREIVEYVRQCQVFVLLLNLADFLGESNAEKRIATEWTLRGLLDYIVLQSGASKDTTCSNPGSKHYAAIVFTQIDRYRSTLSKGESFDHVASKLFPNLYNAYLLQKKCARFFVSAIGSTVTEADRLGKARRVPQMDAKTDDADLQKLMTWISTASQKVAQEIASRPLPSTPQPEVYAAPQWGTDPPPQPPSIFDAVKGYFESAVMLLGIIALIAIGLSVTSAFLPRGTSAVQSTSGNPSPPASPTLRIVNEQGVEGTWYSSGKKIVDIRVENHGPRAKFVVEVKFKAASNEIETQLREVELAANGYQILHFECFLPSEVHPESVRVTQKIVRTYTLTAEQ